MGGRRTAGIRRDGRVEARTRDEIAFVQVPKRELQRRGLERRRGGGGGRLSCCCRGRCRWVGCRRCGGGGLGRLCLGLPLHVRLVEAAGAEVHVLVLPNALGDELLMGLSGELAARQKAAAGGEGGGGGGSIRVVCGRVVNMVSSFARPDSTVHPPSLSLSLSLTHTHTHTYTHTHAHTHARSLSLSPCHTRPAGALFAAGRWSPGTCRWQTGPPT